MISVIVATYNGEKYIIEQLESIYNQELKVDEVLIFDDNSKDNTISLINEYINKKNISNCTIYINKENKGFYNNFMDGLKLAKEKYIFLSDQDDIWYKEKTKVMVEEFLKNEKILSLVSTFSLFNEDIGLIEKHVHHPHSRRRKIKKISLNEYFKFFNYLGMSMAINRDLLKKITIDKDVIKNPSHDIIINFYACFFDGLYYLDKVLTKRRYYDSSVSYVQMNREKRKFSNLQLQRINNAIKYLNYSNYNINQIKIKKTMDKYLKNYEYRREYIKNKKILNWLKNIYNIFFYENFKTFIKDFISIIKSEG